MLGEKSCQSRPNFIEILSHFKVATYEDPSDIFQVTKRANTFAERLESVETRLDSLERKTPSLLHRPTDQEILLYGKKCTVQK